MQIGGLIVSIQNPSQLATGLGQHLPKILSTVLILDSKVQGNIPPPRTWGFRS